MSTIGRCHKVPPGRRGEPRSGASYLTSQLAKRPHTQTDTHGRSLVCETTTAPTLASGGDLAARSRGRKVLDELIEILDDNRLFQRVDAVVRRMHGVVQIDATALGSVEDPDAPHDLRGIVYDDGVHRMGRLGRILTRVGGDVAQMQQVE